MHYEATSRLHRLSARGLCVAVITGLLAGAPPAVFADGDGGHIRVVEAWIRWLPGGLPAGGYLTLRNDGDRPAALTGVSSSAYGMTMLHQSRMEGSVNHMEMVDRITLPAHQTVTFASQGFHIMLEQPVHPVNPGDHVSMTLHFADGSGLDAIAEVRSAAAGAGK